MALQSDGTIWGWGSNSSGQLGIGSEGNSNVPVRLPTLDSNEILSGESSSRYSTSLTVPYGTAWEDISFLETGYAPTPKSSYSRVPVQWNTSKPENYDPHSANSSYTISGVYTSNYNPTNQTPSLVIFISSPKITRVETPSPIAVQPGTPADQLPLPTQVTVYLDDETPKELPVTWNTANYDPTLLDEPQTLTGTLTLTSGVTNPGGLTAQIEVTVVIPPPQIVAIPPQTMNAAQNIHLAPTEKENPFGNPTTESLPATAVAELSDGTTVELPVVWDTAGYDPAVTGLQALTGEVVIAEGLDISNPNNRKASLEITVLPKTYELWDADPLELSMEAAPGTEIADLNRQLLAEGQGGDRRPGRGSGDRL